MCSQNNKVWQREKKKDPCDSMPCNSSMKAPHSKATPQTMMEGWRLAIFCFWVKVSKGEEHLAGCWMLYTLLPEMKILKSNKNAGKADVCVYNNWIQLQYKHVYVSFAEIIFMHVCSAAYRCRVAFRCEVWPIIYICFHVRQETIISHKWFTWTCYLGMSFSTKNYVKTFSV